MQATGAWVQDWAEEGRLDVRNLTRHVPYMRGRLY